jgi:hypothetical protein
MEIKKMNWNDVKSAAHETAKQKGWWTNPRSPKELVMLMISEIAEATEEVRKGTQPVYVPWHDDIVTPDGTVTGKRGTIVDMSIWTHVSGRYKSEGEAVELVDLIIRACDTAGAYDFDISDEANIGYGVGEIQFDQYKSPLEFHADLVQGLAAGMETDLVHSLYRTLNAVEQYFTFKKWDLPFVLDLKMGYNGMRSFRHGGKLY